MKNNPLVSKRYHKVLKPIGKHYEYKPTYDISLSMPWSYGLIRSMIEKYEYMMLNY